MCTVDTYLLAVSCQMCKSWTLTMAWKLFSRSALKRSMSIVSGIVCSRMRHDSFTENERKMKWNKIRWNNGKRFSSKSTGAQIQCIICCDKVTCEWPLTVWIAQAQQTNAWCDRNDWIHEFADLFFVGEIHNYGTDNNKYRAWNRNRKFIGISTQLLKCLSEL